MMITDFMSFPESKIVLFTSRVKPLFQLNQFSFKLIYKIQQMNKTKMYVKLA